MKTQTIYIRFNTISNRINKKGLIALQCRITFNKKRKDFAIGLFVNPKDWDSKKQKLLDSSDQEETINMQLSLIENKISKAFLMLQVKEEPFNVQDILIPSKVRL
jgi:integrase/recombinase XerD